MSCMCYDPLKMAIKQIIEPIKVFVVCRQTDIHDVNDRIRHLCFITAFAFDVLCFEEGAAFMDNTFGFCIFILFKLDCKIK